jgi:aminopeptidase N
VEDYLSMETGIDLSSFFDQYLRNSTVPILEYYFSDDQTFNFRWANCIVSFDMPVDLHLGEKKVRIEPTTKWNQLNLEKKSDLTVGVDYYVGSLKVR